MPESLTQAVFAPKLRVFRKLDVSKLSDEFKETIGKAEGSFQYVDVDLARDLGWTEEIMEATLGAAIVDEHGAIVREFPGAAGFVNAEKARSSARVVFDIDLPVEDDAEDESIPDGFVGLA